MVLGDLGADRPLPGALGINEGKSLISLEPGHATPVLATSKGAGWRRDDLIDGKALSRVKSPLQREVL